MGVSVVYVCVQYVYMVCVTYACMCGVYVCVMNV